jgi:hypothetical protein
VQLGLRQIGVKVSGQSFSYSQGNLQPQSQTITITDKSNQPFNWSIQYAEKNSWLVQFPRFLCSGSYPERRSLYNAFRL